MKILYIVTSCKKSGPIQQTLNLIEDLYKEGNQLFLITIYPEEKKRESVLNAFLPFVNHKYIPINKTSALFGNCKPLREYIDEINPDVIHSLGVFPDYMIERLGYKNHTFTCRNYVYDDYIDEYGVLLGFFLSKIHLKAIKKCNFVRCCSESLHKIYLKKIQIDIPFIRNGVKVEQYNKTSFEEKLACKNELSFPLNKIIWIYSGKFNNRKNQVFLLRSIVKCAHFNESFFVLLGDGPSYVKLKKEYEKYHNIFMPGNVNDVRPYLKASDIYISTSKSEGMPNGVLEAMATGLPVFLSGIEQHREVLSVSPMIGKSYEPNDIDDFIKQFDATYDDFTQNLFCDTSNVVNDYFSSKTTTKNYIKLYQEIIERNN